MKRGRRVGRKNRARLAVDLVTPTVAAAPEDTVSGIYSLNQTRYAVESGQLEQEQDLLIAKGNLAFYLDAKNPESYPGSGNTWYDLSGSGNNFYWNSAPTYTSGSHPYFTSNQLAYGPPSNLFGITSDTGYTIQFLSNNRSLVNSSVFKFYQNNASGSAGRGIFCHGPWSNDNIYFDQGGCCNSNQRVNTGTGGAGSWNLWTLRKNSTSRDIWKNGTRIATNTTAAIGIGLDSRPVTFFGDDDYGTAWNAWASVFIAYSRPLSDAEIISNSNALSSYYGY